MEYNCPICNTPITPGDDCVLIFFAGDNEIAHRRCAGTEYAQRMAALHTLDIPGITPDMTRAIAAGAFDFLSIMQEYARGQYLIVFEMISTPGSYFVVAFQDPEFLRSGESTSYLPRYIIHKTGCRAITTRTVIDYDPYPDQRSQVMAS
jgi:hypothetical protein